MGKETMSPIEGIQNLTALVLVYLDAPPKVDINKIAGRDGGTKRARKSLLALLESPVTRRAPLLGSYLAFHSEATICLLRMHCQSRLCLLPLNLLSIPLNSAAPHGEECVRSRFPRCFHFLLV